MKNFKKTSLLTGSLVAGVLLSTANVEAANNLTFDYLGSGATVRTQLLANGAVNVLTSVTDGLKSIEAKCGEGKCGDKKAEAKSKDAKCGEGKCGDKKADTIKKSEAKSSDAKCGEGKCGDKKAAKKAEAKSKDAKCGEGKCGDK
jgi:uncharacterized low-complexity protein